MISKKIAEAIRDLVDANFWTGYWDNKRFNLCKKPLSEFTDNDKGYLYKTEKMSRFNVENRAVNRNLIEKSFIELFK